MKHRSTPAGLIFWLVVTNLSVVTPAEPHTFIAINRDLEIIKPRKGRQALRRQFEQAGKLLGNWKIVIAGIEIDGPRLVRISQSSPKEPFVRLVREDLRIPVDVADFVYFIDDVLAAGKRGLRGKQVWEIQGPQRNLLELVDYFPGTIAPSHQSGWPKRAAARWLRLIPFRGPLRTGERFWSWTRWSFWHDLRS